MTLFGLCLSVGQTVFSAPAENLGTLANAETNCTEIDLRGSLPQAKPYDQGEKPWCYAYSGALLVSQKLKKAISPEDIALEAEAKDYVGDNIDQLMNSGKGHWAKDALELVNSSKGFCLETQFPIALLPPEKLESLKLEQVRNLPFANTFFVSRHRTDQVHPYLKHRDGRYSFSSQTRNLFATKLPDGSVETYIVSFEGVQNLLQAKDRACSYRVSLPTNVSIKSLIRSDKGSFTLLQKIAFERKQLVAVNFASSLFKDKDTETTHYVTLIGRKWDSVTKTCNYLFRNSYGSDWIKNRGTHIIAEEKVAGDFYMKESLVNKEFLGLTYLEEN